MDANPAPKCRSRIIRQRITVQLPDHSSNATTSCNELCGHLGGDALKFSSSFAVFQEVSQTTVRKPPLA